MKMGTKLLIAFVFAAVIPLMSISLYVRNMFIETYNESATENLATIRENKASSIQHYFKTIESQIELMAQNESIVSAMREFTTAFNRMDELTATNGAEGITEKPSLLSYQRPVTNYYENQFSNALKENNQDSTSVRTLLPRSTAGTVLQNLYIAENPHPPGNKNNLQMANDGSYYSELHGQHHPYFNRFLKAYGFYDIFLVEPDNGNIVYSVYKEIDYGTSLRSGPHSASGIAKAFNAALGKNSAESTLIDYDGYLPSYGAPASFISTPILDNGELLGVLIYQMPLALINEVVNERTGLGESGKTYLVGSEDGMLRTQLPFTEENSVLSFSADMDSINATINNQQLGNHIDQFGTDVQLSAKHIDILGLKWLIAVEQDTEEVFGALNTLEKALWVALGLSALISVAISVWITRSTKKQLGAEPEFLNTIANEIAAGNLTRNFGDTNKQTGTLKVMASMQNALKERDEADQANLVRIKSLTDGLEKLNTPVVLANHEHTISFANLAMRELISKYATDLRTVAPSLDPSKLDEFTIAQFSKDPSALRTQLNNLGGSFEYELQAGSRTFRLILNGILADDGERIGSSMEWTDITEERRVMQEVDSVVESAHNGDLHSRVNLQDKKGVYLGLSKKVNGLLDVTEDFVAEISEFLSAIADGNLSKNIDKEYGGSFANVKRDGNRSVGKLLEVVTSIRSVAGTVDTAAREINTGNLDLSQRTEQAAASLQETSSSMEEMTASVAQNADNSKQAKQLALAAREQAEKGGEVVGEAVNAMTGINESSLKIADIIGVIDDIAFQTNLLALNASVEAARAGEQGRGFAVVASEVRNLAGRSATAAKEIKELIEDSVNRVKNGAELVNESGKTLEGIVTQVKKVTDIVSEISAASQEQSEGITHVNNAISQLDNATQQNAALVEEASAASQSTTDQAANLIRLIGFFSGGQNGESNTTNTAVMDNSTTTSTVQVTTASPSNIPNAPANAPTYTPPAKVANTDLNDDWEEF